MASIGEDITRKLIERGGIKSGMKILDLGCGEGNVTFLLSNYVGSEGIVVGIDSNENAIDNARKKSIELGHSNLYFIVGDITQDFKIEHSNFDVIIVRRALMYLSNLQSTIVAAIKHLKPNGIFLAQENNISHVPIGLESMPHHKKINDLIRKTLERENVNFNLGFELNTILTNAGLTVENVWAEAVLSTPNQPTPWFFLAQVMKDRMLTHKVISDVSELELEILGERLTNERMENSRTFISDLVFCAVARNA
ncbi:class I SAM-dependent methyltransferase [uncultured Sunxiuqinia sp.]|uniref:class I SAM-dependent methyltransferase n=1 Tax=uncultured Sunxiuqinia sp. TaxID=1573825 RepID=UPI002AA8FBB6|nr:class I SAM-dependent methyltransferase [uncultured Sunxiuqinia sp.]